MVLCYVDPNHSLNPNFENKIVIKLQTLIFCRISSFIVLSSATFAADSVRSYMMLRSLIMSLVGHNT